MISEETDPLSELNTPDIVYSLITGMTNIKTFVRNSISGSLIKVKYMYLQMKIIRSSSMILFHLLDI